MAVGGPRFQRGRGGLTAREINRWNQVADAVQRDAGKRAANPSSNPLWPPIMVKNDLANPVLVGGHVGIDGLEFPTTWDQLDVLATAVPAGADIETPVIALDPIPVGEVGRCIVLGAAYARVAAGDVGAGYATPDASGSLKPSIEPANIKLLGAPSATEATVLPVILGASTAGGRGFYVATLTGTITAGSPSSAFANIIDPANESTVIESGVTVYGNLGMFNDLEVGDSGIVAKAQDGEFYLVNAPCDPEPGPVNPLPF